MTKVRQVSVDNHGTFFVYQYRSILVHFFCTKLVSVDIGTLLLYCSIDRYWNTLNKYRPPTQNIKQENPVFVPNRLKNGLPSICFSYNLSINQSTNQSINLSINQQNNQPINQPVSYHWHSQLPQVHRLWPSMPPLLPKRSQCAQVNQSD